MEFEWDESKRAANLSKHGLDFVRASSLFDGRPVITAASIRSDEARYATTGLIDEKFCTVIWTWRGTALRIISARRARHEEERRYRELHRP